jgi:hypothetical protein
MNGYNQQPILKKYESKMVDSSMKQYALYKYLSLFKNFYSKDKSG